MAADDLSAPLGRQTKRGRAVSVATIIASLPQAITIALAVFLCVFLLWAVLADNPFGGEPMTVTQISQQTAPHVVSDRRLARSPRLDRMPRGWPPVMMVRPREP